MYTNDEFASVFSQENCYLLFSASSSMPGRERLPIVFKMKWATDDTGEVALWANGKKVLEYKGIKTVKAPGTFERLQIFGTIAQPAYDAPPHVRKVDAMLFTDKWQDIVDGGYLRDPSQAQPEKDGE